jgi:hypothetical protein
MTSQLDTDLSRSPYFDDYDQTKNFYRILYRPAVAVQTREVNQMQSILQDQIDKFGRSIFKEGSVIEGCAFTFDNKYNYVKINDNYANGSAISTLSAFNNYYITNQNGLNALIVNTVSGYQSQDPDLNTLYVKYQNSTTYSNGVTQSVFDIGDSLQITTSANVSVGNVSVTTLANPTGKGYAFTTTEGVIFKKGFFIRVTPQTLVVSKYSNLPDSISVGFNATELIVTPESDTSLVDNASGSPNYQAPGAHRLKLVPELITRNSADISNTTSFFSLCDFKLGFPVSIKNDPQYAALAASTAKRTFETSGNYVVQPFLLSVETKYNVANNVATLDSTYHNLLSSPGVGYVRGYRVEYVNSNVAKIRKGTDYLTTSNQLVGTTYGNYVYVNEFTGDFNTDNLVQVEIHKQTYTSVTSKTFLNTSYVSGNKIGTAYVRSLDYFSNTSNPNQAQYTLSIFNVQMLAGFKFSDAKSMVYYNASTVKAVADLVLVNRNTAGTLIAAIQRSAQESLIFNIGQRAIKPDGFATTGSMVYRNKSTASFLAGSANGSLTLTIGASAGAGTESFNVGVGSYAPTVFTSIVPTQNGYSTVKPGTVSVNLTSSNVVGSGTTFLSHYSPGDYLFVSNSTYSNTKVVNTVYTDTLMSVDSVFGYANGVSQHQKVWISGHPIISDGGLSPYVTVANSTSATVTIGDACNADFSATIYHDVYRANTVAISKAFQNTTYIKIQANTNAGGVNGPWCLGVSDALKLNNVYLDQTGGTYSTSNPDQTNLFTLDNGQRDSYYGLAFISSTTPIAPNATILVSVQNFISSTSQGVGFFTAASYPLDDVSSANTLAIRTYQIPTYTSAMGVSYDLRDCVDFRPYAVNTGISNTNYANGAPNVSAASVDPSDTLTIYTYGANGAYLSPPGGTFSTQLSYYLPRTDIVSITTAGDLIVTEGAPALKPVAPPDIPGTMTIGKVFVPPYPSLTPTQASSVKRYDYAITTTLLQSKRYTMSDIGKLSTRVDNLEYYTSLSLLETSTTNLLVKSGTTGQNRFKNGILVDPFNDHTIGNTRDPGYVIAIDPDAKEARPFFNQYTTAISFDAASSSAVKVGKVIMIPYTPTVVQTQPYASKYRNCLEGGFFSFTGSIVLDPPGVLDGDITQTPVVTNSIDMSSNIVNLANRLNSFGSTFNNWTSVGNINSAVDSESHQISNSGRTYSQGQLQTWQTTTTTTLSQQQQKVTSAFSTTPSSTTMSLGNFVTGTSIQKYVPPRQIFFKATGMKPNTRLYVYFQNTVMDQKCLPLTPYTGTRIYIGGNWFANDGSGQLLHLTSDGLAFSYILAKWGTAQKSDDNGNVYGIFSIPPNTFKSGSIEFKLTDISDITLGVNAATTTATATMLCTPLGVQTSQVDLQIRSATINLAQSVDTRTVQLGQTTNVSTSQIFDRTIVTPSCPPQAFPGNTDQIAQGWGPAAVGGVGDNNDGGGGGGGVGDGGG